MKTLIISLLLSSLIPLSFASDLKDLKPGEYKLVSGDEEACEDGPVRFMEGDLHIGTRLILLQVDKSTYSYQNDDKSCQSLIKNSKTKEGFKQLITHKCKTGNSKRTIELTLPSPEKFSYSIVAKDMSKKKIECSLELVK